MPRKPLWFFTVTPFKADVLLYFTIMYNVGSTAITWNDLKHVKAYCEINFDIWTRPKNTVLESNFNFTKIRISQGNVR